MKYAVGDLVYVRDLPEIGKVKLVGVEMEWRGCVERLKYCKVRTSVGVIKVHKDNVLTEGEMVAEKLKKRNN